MEALIDVIQENNITAKSLGKVNLGNETIYEDVMKQKTNLGLGDAFAIYFIDFFKGYKEQIYHISFDKIKNLILVSNNKPSLRFMIVEISEANSHQTEKNSYYNGNATESSCNNKNINYSLQNYNESKTQINNFAQSVIPDTSNQKENYGCNENLKESLENSSCESCQKIFVETFKDPSNNDQEKNSNSLFEKDNQEIEQLSI